jgi:biotin carboxylase
MKRILVVMPTAWDAKQIAACPGLTERFEVVFAEPADADCPASLDPVAFVESVVAGAYGRLDGVFSSSDYPGATLAGAIATRLGLPGSPPGTIVGCSHKYVSRLVQREAVPEAVPDFDLIAPRVGATPKVGFPCFVKPVKGAYSVFARRVENQAELDGVLANPGLRDFLEEYLAVFNQIVWRMTELPEDGRWLIAEELLPGLPATVEGFVTEGEVHVLGVVDSTCDPATGSFLRFDYPSALDPAVQERMGDIARRAIRALGLTHSLFNVELAWDPARDRIAIIEVNPRMCGQFADLYQKVDATSGYEVALALAAGERPALARGAGAYAAAASFPLRVFRPTRVVRAPDARDLREAEELFPGTLVWNECAGGDLLRDFEVGEDGRSHRYAVVNLGGPDRAGVAARLEQVRRRLGYVLEAL